MLVVETIGKIRRDHFVHGKSIKAIARDRGLSRNTVRKVLRSKETAFCYERQSQPLPKLGGHVEGLEGLLEQNLTAGKRDRLTWKRPRWRPTRWTVPWPTWPGNWSLAARRTCGMTDDQPPGARRHAHR